LALFPSFVRISNNRVDFYYDACAPVKRKNNRRKKEDGEFKCYSKAKKVIDVQERYNKKERARGRAESE
jgi:hypothetical protein